MLGLAGFAATFVTGALIMKPRGDYVVLVMVVVDMALKPTGEGVGVLAAMAAVLLAGVAYVVASYRAIEAPEPAFAS